MKTSFFSILFVASFLATSSFATVPAMVRYNDRPVQQGPYDRLNDHNDKDFNYGFGKTIR
ncbi:hypothetical protein [Hymenobacter negativus]|uniref:Uncharacterized protein n=1 Tax=Hymenobacter negativus TaxID=2795026 RepID=A0ABS3QDW4_9BACT|nr:hypothetical protein [Hymenobacter negativus]MBO2009432.1 hypothetical protein [Hymenobacter negativus]